MKHVILHFKPKVGYEKELTIQIELGKSHPQYDLGPRLAILEIAPGKKDFQRFPGYGKMPVFTEKEVDSIISHSLVYWKAYFNCEDSHPLAFDDKE